MRSLGHKRVLQAFFESSVSCHKICYASILQAVYNVAKARAEHSEMLGKATKVRKN
jgi:hypothetical protein